LSAHALKVVAWQRAYGRHGLPWQQSRDPYHVWLSEIMLQQTQVQAVLGYYQRFLARCPDVFSLAQASADDVMALWAGLGYYSRARNLHACAKIIVRDYAGRFPDDAQALAQLPGIGRSTAAAIAAFCFARPEPILDGNVKRVLARVHAVEGWPGASVVEKQLWRHAQQWMNALMDQSVPDQRPALLTAYTQGFMDLGATLCKPRRPECDRCPLADDCRARALGITASIPGARPAKSLPVQHCVLWLVQSPRGLLMQRQPEVGLWGGLWVPPRDLVGTDTWPLQQAQLQAMAQKHGYRLQAIDPVFMHAFSHFKLQIVPVWVQGEPGVGEPDPRTPQAWFDEQGLAALGMPAPVRKLLSRGLRPLG
jgi:A/G-specific adenine glycosylase